ncbi:hypothetical protein PCI56_10805 [Plesiomonas shigelloides subsp. oncorhynchi]|nr:hypothetical protein [Plesiomonas shigelloides]
MMDADAAARLSDNEAYALIFAPGFSTKKKFPTSPAAAWGWTW